MLGSRVLASLGPFLGAPAGSPGQVKYTGGTGSGAWHPLTPSWVPPSTSLDVLCVQIMEDVEVVQLVPTAGEQIVVCQCHRSCRYVEVASLYGVLPQAQFFVHERCLGWSVQKPAVSAVAVLTLGSMTLLCRSSVGFCWGFQ